MKSSYLGYVLLCAIVFASAAALEQDNKGNITHPVRHKKVLSFFQVVSFANAPCTGTSSTNNGTCYSSTECTSKGGSSSGTCAEGFGVCCIFKLSCGGTSSVNMTYISQASSTSVTSPCSYKICAESNDICRMKLDFRSFDISAPQVGTTVTVATASPKTYGGAIGDCLTDTFTVKNPGGANPPVICGYNSGQHMIVDVDPSMCIDIEFVLGGSSSAREWDIVVNQYTCGDSHDLVGAPGSGCLQFVTDGVSGSFKTFNWPATTNAATTTTHLSNQEYTICIRQEQGYCGICYCPAIASPFASGTFGVSVSGAAPKGASEATCTSDYIAIPHAGVAARTLTSITEAVQFCGRWLAVLDATAIDTPNAPADAIHYTNVSICSYARPFIVKVFFDADEVSTATAANMATLNEMQAFPGGIIGFKLNYIQQTC